jgi:hypothetical protein
MESTQIIEHISNAPINPFSITGSMWIVWFLVGILVLWIDLTRKVNLGLLSIAAFIAVFTSFHYAVSSQVLVFGFFGLALTVADHAHKQHQARMKRWFVH